MIVVLIARTLDYIRMESNAFKIIRIGAKTKYTLGAFVVRRFWEEGKVSVVIRRNNRGSLGITEISRYFFSLPLFIPRLPLSLYYSPFLSLSLFLPRTLAVVCHAYEWNDFATSWKNCSAVKRLPFIHGPARWTPDSDAVNHDNSRLLCASEKNGFPPVSRPFSLSLYLSLESTLETRRLSRITASK